jgi:hypothetical protein
MSSPTIVSATFSTLGRATAAIDWFLNQSIDRDAITVQVAPPGEQPRPPRPGDNRRAELTWIVNIDVGRARLSKQIALETMIREGGSISKQVAAGV